MNSLIVDDRRLIVLDTIELMKEFDPDGIHMGCCDAQEALQLAEQYPMDVALLDVEMPGISGITLGEMLRKRYPRINIIFITSYSQYAADAFRVNASDYLLKPIDPDDLFAALSNLRFESRSELKKRVYVQCFGSFEVFVDDKPVIFKRSRSKELFAFLIDRRGAMITQDQILGILYPEEAVSETLMASVRNYCLDIVKTFDALNCGETIVRGKGQISVDVNQIDCDYLRFLKGDQLAIHGFVGEYMREYEFARETEALLIWKMEEK